MRSGWNHSSASSFSPTPTNLIGLPVTALHRERRAAARVAVELRQDDAVEVDPLLERLRDVDGLLAGHRVEDEQDVRRLRLVATAASSSISSSSMCRRPAVSRMTTSRPSRLRALDAVAHGLDRVGALVRVDRHADLLAELARAGRSPRGAGGRPRRAPASCPPSEQQRELAGGGRLARALQAGEEDRRRRPLREGERDEPSPSARSAPRGRSSRPAGPASGSSAHPAPSARSRTCATNSLTTPKLTSASSSARRTSRIAREIASSSSVPRPRRSPSALWSLSLSASNIGRRVPGRAVRLAAVRGVALCLAACAVLLLAACGGGSRLSQSAYRTKLAQVKQEAASAQASVAKACRRRPLPSSGDASTRSRSRPSASATRLRTSSRPRTRRLPTPSSPTACTRPPARRATRASRHRPAYAAGGDHLPRAEPPQQEGGSPGRRGPNQAAAARLHERQLGHESTAGLESGQSGGQTAYMVSAAAARKTVSVLFCDLAGSTMLGERLDPEPLRELLAGGTRRCGPPSSATAARWRSSSATR